MDVTMDVVVVIDAPRELPILINDLANETAFARRQRTSLVRLTPMAASDTNSNAL